MPKSKTQAEKRQQQAERNKEKEELRQKEKEARALAIQKQRQEELKEAKSNKKNPEPKEPSKTTVEQPKEKNYKNIHHESKNQDAVANDIVNESKNAPVGTTEAQMMKLLKAAAQQASDDVKAESLSKPTSTNRARIIENHTTYVEGLKTVLVRLSQLLPGSTIIPGELTQLSNKVEELELRFQRTLVDEHTHKFVARNGYTAQDVSISVTNHEKFTKEFLSSSIEKIISDKSRKTVPSIDNKEVSLGLYNRVAVHEQQQLWKQAHKNHHQRTKLQQHNVKKNKIIQQQVRKLASKGLPSGQIRDYAERDVSIITGENRTKNSM